MGGSGTTLDGAASGRTLPRLCIAALACSALLSPPSAHATPTVVGQLFTPATSCVGEYTYLQTAVASGTAYTVPVAGVIASWSFREAGTTVPGLKLKVARPIGGGSFTIIGESAAGTQVPNSVNTYPAQIAVQPGDVIGVHVTGGTCGTHNGVPSDTYAYVAGDPTPGTPTAFSASDSFLVPVSAVVQPPVTTGQRAAALASCKKRAHKHHWSHKRLRKCMKKASQLPA